MSQFAVYPQLPSPGMPTLGRAVEAFLGHLALRVQTDNFSADNFGNLLRDLNRFAAAWHVVFADGRQAIVPLAEPERFTLPSGRLARRRPLKFGAGDVAAAIVQAKKLVNQLRSGLALAGDVAGDILVRRNRERSLAEAGNDDLIRWLAANPQWVSGHSKTNAMAAIVNCFRWFEDEFGVKSPYQRRRLPTFVRPSRREADAAEYVALMRHTSCRELRVALWALWNVQGLRTCEMREMVWSDINWAGSFVLTYRHKTARATNKPRLITLTARQLRLFKALQRRRLGDHVFANTDGQPWTRRAFAQNLRRTARKIGLDDAVVQKVSGYCFRHSYATQAEEAGANMDEAGMLMGHAPGSRLARETYSKASRKVQHHRQAAEKIERLRRQARKQKPPAPGQGELF